MLRDFLHKVLDHKRLEKETKRLTNKKHKKMKKALFSLALAALLMPTALKAQTAVSTFPWEDNFSDSVTSVSNWTLGNWVYYSDFGNFDDGCMAAFADATLVSPSFAIPASANGLMLVYYVYGQAQYGAYGLQGEYSVVIFDGTTYDTIDQYSSNTNGFDRMEFDLSSSALVVDDFKVGPVSAPRYTIDGSLYPIVGRANAYNAVRIEGDLTGVTYQWASQTGTATGSGNSASVTYTAAGNDTVSVTVTNNYGSYTAKLGVEVLSCGNITSFPHMDDLETPYANCWAPFNNNGVAGSDFYVFYNPNYAHSGSYSLISSYDATTANDNWVVSSAIVMPANANGMQLSWWYMGGAYQAIAGRYQVLVSTTGTAMTDFTTVLHDETILSTDPAARNYNQARASLANYAGQTIYIAFRNMTDADGNNFFIDDIEIRAALEPVYTVQGPTSTQVGIANTLTATYVEGEQTGMTFSWTSAMASNGQATIANANSENATITYNASGNDVIIFTATNAHGTFADTLNVSVVSCDAVTTFPWNEGFEGGVDCWTLFNNDGGARGFVQAPNGTNSPSHSGDYSLIGVYSDNYQVDQWAVSQEISLPAGSNMELSWWYYGGAWDASLGRYEVLVSTGGTNPSDFTSIYSATIDTNDAAYSDYVQSSVSLANYAGQTIRIAFHNTTDQGGNALFFDDIAIVAGTQGIAEVKNNAISVSPNPATSMVEIDATGIEGQATVSIVDLNGRTLMQQQGNAAAYRFDVSTLPAGAYFVRLTSDNTTAVQKLIVK